MKFGEVDSPWKKCFSNISIEKMAREREREGGRRGERERGK
jgi:hypothetical protein